VEADERLLVKGGRVFQACSESGSGRIWIPHPGKKGGFRLFALTVATFSLQVSEDLLNHI
jgi:hypothetical protein